MTTDGSDSPGVWAIRLTERAQVDLADAWRDIAVPTGDAIADSWESGPKSELSTVARLPERTPMAKESRFFSPAVRKLLDRRTPRSPAYFALFTLETAPEDPPTIRFKSIRFGARAPITRKEAREIEAFK